MKVAYDAQIFGGQIYGGVSRYYCELAARLSKRTSIDVSIAAPMHVNEYLKSLPEDILSGFSSPLPYDFMRLPQRVASMALGDLVLRFLQPDIIHETYYLKYPLGPARAKRVLTIYDMIHEKFEAQFQYGDKTAKHKAIAAERADHVICISESTKQDVMEILGVNPEKISVVHLGFDLMQSPQKKVKEITFEEKPYLLYVGTRGGYKNFQRFLEAYANSTLLSKEFRVISFGGGVFNAEELALMEKLNLTKNQVTQLSGDDYLLGELYKSASIFVFPSLYEGFGIPPLEAMSYGCPVACSNNSSIPEVVGNAGLLFDPYDVESIQKAIEHVVESTDVKESLIRKGKERLNNFSWDKCADETHNIYRSLL